jgi:membrane protein implicated in regulation of membrane protease activity
VQASFFRRISRWFQIDDEPEGVTDSVYSTVITHGLEYLEDDVGIVCHPISPLQPGQIEFRGSWWMAACQQNIILLPRTYVRVIDIQLNTCIVEPIYPIQPNL